MKRTQKQLRIDWEARPKPPVAKDQDDDSSGDPMVDAVNELFAIYDLLEGDDFAQEHILEKLQEQTKSWSRYLQHCAGEMLEERMKG